MFDLIVKTSFGTRIRNLIIFLVFYITFFLYFRTVYFSNAFLLYFGASKLALLTATWVGECQNH